MSLILDALRGRSPDRDASGAPQTARADGVLATLGYSKRQGRSRSPLKALVLYGAGAILVGFVGLALLITLVAPPTPPDQDAIAQRSAGTPAPARPPTAVPQATETPRPPPPAAPSGLGTPAALSQAAPGGGASAPPDAGTGKAKQQLAAPAPPEPAAGRPQPPEPVAVRPAARAVREAPAVPRPPPAVAPRPAPAVTAPEPVSVSATAPVRPPVDHFGLALYYQRTGDFDNALLHYRTLLEQKKAGAEVHNNLGLLYQDRGQLDEAMKEFQQAIAIDPKYVRAHNNFGVALLRAGRLDAASGELRVALAEEPRNVESIVNLALVHKAAGRAAEARDLLQRAVGVDPRNAGARYNLAVVADEGGDSAAAVEHYRAFLRLGAVAHADLVTPVRARLAALGG